MGVSSASAASWLDGRGTPPTAVYPYAGTVVYENSMPSFPQSRQFVYFRNAHGKAMYVAEQSRGTSLGVAVCRAPGWQARIDSGTASMWVVKQNVSYSCKVGDKQYFTLPPF